MIGIYTITSPSGKIYIGQSWNIEKRHQDYRYLKCKDMPRLYYSFVKYGVNAHIFQIVLQLPEDIEQCTLDAFEIFCIEQYKSSGANMLNVKDGGSRGRHAAESIEKVKQKRKLQVPPTLGRTFDTQWRKNISDGNLGRKFSEEQLRTMAPIWEARRGRRHTEGAKENMRRAQAILDTWSGRKHSDESRRLQSLAKLGNKINCKKVRQISTGRIFNSLGEAAESVGVQMKTLSARIVNKYTKNDFEYV